MRNRFFKRDHENSAPPGRLLLSAVIVAAFAVFCFLVLYAVRGNLISVSADETDGNGSRHASSPEDLLDDSLLTGVSFEDGEALTVTAEVYIPETSESIDPMEPYFLYTTIEGEKSGASVTLRAFIPQVSVKTRSASVTYVLDSEDRPFSESYGRIETGGLLFYEIRTGDYITEGSVMASAAGNLTDMGTMSRRVVEYDGENSLEQNFFPGEDISVSARAVSAEDEQSASLRSYAEANSLFAVAEAEGSTLNVSVNSLRHLRNLNREVSDLSISRIGTGIEKIHVIQTADIEGEEDTVLSPIENDRIASFDGGIYEIRNLRIEQDEAKPAGLFSVFTGDSISSVKLSNVTIRGGDEPSGGLCGILSGPEEARITGCSLIDTKIKGNGIAGGLVGTLGADTGLQIDNCSLYMTDESCTDSSVAGDTKTQDWLSGGNVVGGLVGIASAPLSIDKSFAATVIYATGDNSRVGGLIGNALSSLSVHQSYADSYLHGDVIGGLAGGCTGKASFKTCYSAGFVLDPEEATEPEIEGMPSVGGTIAAQFVPNAAIRVGAGIEDSYSLFCFEDITEASTGKSMPDYSGKKDAYVTKDEQHRIQNGFLLWENVNVEQFSDTMRTGNSEQHTYQLASYLKNGGNDDFSEYPRLGLPHYGDFVAMPMEYEIIAYDPLGPGTTYDALGQRIMQPLYRASYYAMSDRPFSDSKHTPPKHGGYEFYGYQFPGNVNRDLISKWDSTTTLEDMVGYDRIATFSDVCYGVKRAKLELNYQKVYTIKYQDTKGSSSSTKEYREAGERLLESWPSDPKGKYIFLGYSFAKDSELIPVFNQKQDGTLLGDLLIYEEAFTDENKNTITLYLRWKKVDE